MGTEATGLNGNKALSLVRARSRATRVDDGALRTPVTVPFLWEDAPGRPKPHSVPPDGGATAAGTDEGDAKARLMPLKLPPRLQVPSAATDHALSPSTVLQGPYGCTGGPRRTALRRSGTIAANSFRRTPSASGGFFSRRNKAAAAATWTSHDHDAAGSCTPSPSSASSSTSSSSLVSFFGDDSRGLGARRRPGDGRAGPEEDEGSKGSVRITRLTRNRSLPTSHLWASIRRSVKQIAPWS